MTVNDRSYSRTHHFEKSQEKRGRAHYLSVDERDRLLDASRESACPTFYLLLLMKVAV